jgi:membrane-associated protease RseP (regulator of RpoE activity)
MRRLLTLLFLAAAAVPVTAQETPKPPRQPRPPRDTTVERSYRYEFGPEQIWTQVGRRARLGVVVDLSADPARDSIGARITGVTPGGAADKAGVRTGDIVVQINGERVARADSEGGEDLLGSRPGRRLVELASRLHTGDSVRLELRRDGRPLNVTLVAGESGMEDMLRTFHLRAPLRAFAVPFEGGNMNFAFSGSPLGDLELVKVNPGLADYFGTSEGILVVNTAGDSALGLKAGDVILSIGGRKPNSPSHAFRILGTYDPGESVSFEVMRMKRHVNVTGKMPERHGWRVMPNMFDEDLLQPGHGMMELIQPDLEHSPLLKDLPGSGGMLKLRITPPDLQRLKDLPGQLPKVRHRTVET